VDTELRGEIRKVDPERRMLWGWSYVAKANGEQVEDHSGDVVDTPEAVAAMESAFYNYALEHRSGDLSHESFGVAKLVEQVVFTPEKIEKMGLHESTPVGVWSGYYIPPDDDGPGDQYWEAVKSGEIKALSIVGRGRRESIG
jgi:Putative phage serine protease XkdF